MWPKLLLLMCNECLANTKHLINAIQKRHQRNFSILRIPISHQSASHHGQQSICWLVAQTRWKLLKTYTVCRCKCVHLFMELLGMVMERKQGWWVEGCHCHLRGVEGCHCLAILCRCSPCFCSSRHYAISVAVWGVHFHGSMDLGCG